MIRHQNTPSDDNKHDSIKIDRGQSYNNENTSPDSSEQRPRFWSKILNNSTPTMTDTLTNKSWLDLMSLAMDEKTDPEILDQLTYDNNAFVCSMAAANPSITKRTLARLVNSDEPFVRMGVAINDNTTPYMLNVLSYDDMWQPRCVVAVNTNTSEATLARLSTDNNWLVRLVVADNPNTSKETLESLSTDKNWFVRRVANKVRQRY